jgi:hypothetical protein
MLTQVLRASSFSAVFAPMNFEVLAIPAPWHEHCAGTMYFNTPLRNGIFF